MTDVKEFVVDNAKIVLIGNQSPPKQIKLKKNKKRKKSTKVEAENLLWNNSIKFPTKSPTIPALNILENRRKSKAQRGDSTNASQTTSRLPLLGSPTSLSRNSNDKEIRVNKERGSAKETSRITTILGSLRRTPSSLIPSRQNLSSALDWPSKHFEQKKGNDKIIGISGRSVILAISLCLTGMSLCGSAVVAIASSTQSKYLDDTNSAFAICATMLSLASTVVYLSCFAAAVSKDRNLLLISICAIVLVVLLTTILVVLYLALELPGYLWRDYDVDESNFQVATTVVSSFMLFVIYIVNIILLIACCKMSKSLSKTSRRNHLAYNRKKYARASDNVDRILQQRKNVLQNHRRHGKHNHSREKNRTRNRPSRSRINHHNHNYNQRRPSQRKEKKHRGAKYLKDSEIGGYLHEFYK